MESQPNIWTFICRMFSQCPTNPSAIRNLGMFEGSGSCDKLMSQAHQKVLYEIDQDCTFQCVSERPTGLSHLLDFCRSMYRCHVQKIGVANCFALHAMPRPLLRVHIQILEVFLPKQGPVQVNHQHHLQHSCKCCKGYNLI